MAAAANIVVAVVGVDALEGEAADKLEAHAAVVVDELGAHAAAAVDKLVDVVVAVDKLGDAEGGAVRGTCPGTEEVGRVELTAAAAYVAGRLSFSSSKNRSVGSFGPTHVAIGQLS